MNPARLITVLMLRLFLMNRILKGRIED